MPTQPTRRDRWLALGLLVALLTLAYLLFVHPWFTVPLQAIGEDISALQERQQRVQAQLQQQPKVQARLAEVRSALETQPGFLAEATAESAAAALGSRLQEVVESASQGHQSCSISNRTPMTGERSGGAYPKVSLQVRLRCGVDELAAVLQALEAGSPRLFVENLNVLAQRYQQSPDETGTGLDVSFEVVGYLDPEGAARRAAAVGAGEASGGPAMMPLQPDAAGGAEEVSAEAADQPPATAEPDAAEVDDGV